MKLENTTENKERVFAQYFNQYVDSNLGRIRLRDGITLENLQFIELKNLKDINETQLREIGSFVYGMNEIEPEVLHNLGYNIMMYCFGTPQNLEYYPTIDLNYTQKQDSCNPEVDIIIKTHYYLISRSYLVDCIGLDKEEIIKLGWVKYEK